MHIAASERNSLRILIVEDEFVIARDISDRLTRMGYEICATAPSGEKALTAVEKHQPDLALMDIVLQGDMDGIETAGLLGERHNLPVIFLTAYADDRTLQRAKLAKPLGYVVKPYTEENLRATLDVALYRDAIQRRMQKRQEALYASEKRMRAAFDSSPDALIIADENGQVQWFNLAAELMFGYRAEEIVGLDLRTILPGVPIAMVIDAADTREMAEQIDTGNPVSEQEGLHSSGALIQTEMAMAVWSTDGGRYLTLTLRHDYRGRKRERQLRLDNQKLLKMNARLGHFAHLVARDFHRPVRAVRNAAQGIVDELRDMASEEIRANVDRIAANSARMGYELDNLIEYSSSELAATGARTIDLVDEITDIQASLDAGPKPTITVVGPVKKFRADPTPIQFVLRSLIEHAACLSEPEPVTIAVRCEDDEALLRFNIVASVRTSPDPQSIELEKAYRLDRHRPPKMSLALAKRVVEDNGGMIEVHSLPYQNSSEICFSWAKTMIE